MRMTIEELLKGKASPKEETIPQPCTVPLSIDEEPEPAGAPIPPRLAELKARFESRHTDLARQIEPPKPTYVLNGKPWATPGNISAFSAMSKAGKSSVVGGILASTFPGKGDCFGFESSNQQCKAVIHIDTEQSLWHHHKKVQAMATRVGLQTLPTWFHSFQMSGVALNLELLKDFCELYALEHGGIHSIVLDGGIDFIKDPNNQEESFEFIRELMALAQEYNTHIVVVLHINPGSMDGKTRGHFGSELDRKAETNLTIKMDKVKRIVHAKSARDTYIPEEAGTEFAWDDEAQCFMTINITEGGSSITGISDLTILERLKHRTTKDDIIDWIVEDGKVSEKTAIRKINQLVSQKYISQAGKLRSYTLRVAKRGVELLKSSGRWFDGDEEE
jgi:hypothetical protein